MEKQELLQHIPVFAALSQEHLAILATNLIPQRYDRGATIVRQGSPGSVLYIIIKGQVRVYRISDTGQELSVSILRAGDFFGELSLLDGEPRSASVEAMAATVTLVLSRETFRQVVHRDPEIAMAVMATLATRFRSITSYAEDLASVSAPRRVVRRLLDLASSCGERDGGTGIYLHLTQDDIASLAGTTRETVNRVLGSLRDQGLVRVERARLSIPSVGGLQQALDEW